MEPNVILIEFHNRKPHTVIEQVGKNRVAYIDVEYSRLDKQFYWHESGGGPIPSTFAVSGDYWTASNEIPIKQHGTGRRVKRTKYAIPCPQYAEESETIYCEICRDFRPVEYTYCPCDHIQWCDNCAVWRTQNGDNECDCAQSG